MPGMHTLLALSDQSVAKPLQVERNHPSTWHSARPGSEVVMISHPLFADALPPLVRLRRAQGKSVALVHIDQLYDEFNFGQPSPYAIRDFLKTATEKWQKKPKYLLLVGDASVDPRDYLGFGFFDFVPTKLILTSELKTASDDPAVLTSTRTEISLNNCVSLPSNNTGDSRTNSLRRSLALAKRPASNLTS